MTARKINKTFWVLVGLTAAVTFLLSIHLGVEIAHSDGTGGIELLGFIFGYPLIFLCSCIALLCLVELRHDALYFWADAMERSGYKTFFNGMGAISVLLLILLAFIYPISAIFAGLFLIFLRLVYGIINLFHSAQK